MRLIDADEFINTTKIGTTLALMCTTNGTEREILKATYELIKERIEDAPTADAVPVKHGHWEEIKCNTILDKAVFSKALKCSECGKWKFGNVLLTQRFYYCPNCGAKMDSSEVR